MLNRKIGKRKKKRIKVKYGKKYQNVGERVKWKNWEKKENEDKGKRWKKCQNVGKKVLNGKIGEKRNKIREEG